MDLSAIDISFDDEGICNYCHEFEKMEEHYPTGEVGKEILDKLISKIKKEGEGKKYDCIIGMSGGTDSSYSLLLAIRLGLRPLAVHFDNGWNTEIAVSNIEKVLKYLNLDLETYVVDWQEMRDIQLAFLKASVPEVEIPTDLAIRSVLYKIAKEQNIQYIIEGNSFRTEGLVPTTWSYKDGRYIKSVHEKHGAVSMKTFPNLLLSKYFYYAIIKRIKIVNLLNYVTYTKELAKEDLIKTIGWRDYGGHHYESVYTRFFMGFLAPKKFNMDRRKVSLSALIRLGRISRKDALNTLKDDEYLKNLFKIDKKYLCKKFGLTTEEFNDLIQKPVSSSLNYNSYYNLFRILNPIIYFLRKQKILTGIFQSGTFRQKS